MTFAVSFPAISLYDLFSVFVASVLAGEGVAAVVEPVPLGTKDLNLALFALPLEEFGPFDRLSFEILGLLRLLLSLSTSRSSNF